MGKEQIEITFSKEEVEILRNVLLISLTALVEQITSLQVDKDHSDNSEEANLIQKEIDYFTKRHSCTGKLLYFLRGDLL